MASASAFASKFFGKMDDGDVPAGAGVLTLDDREEPAIVGPGREGEGAAGEALGVAAVGTRDPQVAAAVHIGDPIERSGRPRPDLAVVWLELAAAVQHQAAEPQLVSDVRAAHVDGVDEAPLERADAVHRQLRVVAGRDPAEAGRTDAAGFPFPVSVKVGRRRGEAAQLYARPGHR